MEITRSLFVSIVTATFVLMLFVFLSVDRLTQDGTSRLTPSSSRSLSSRPLPLLPNATLLLLVTKGRSGSTFTSSLINSSKDVYFKFEPLHIVKQIDYENPSHRARIMSIVKASVSCDVTHYLFASDLAEPFLKHTGPSGQRFIDCQAARDSGYRHIQCLIDMVKFCRSQKVIFSKLIRFPLAWAEDFLREYPNLKILYLIRDPRAVVSSQKRNLQLQKWTGDIELNSKKHCRMIKSDVEAIQRFRILFPGRIQVIRYENGALNPMEYAKMLYNFVGLKFSNRTAKFVHSLKNTNGKTETAFGVIRSDPKSIINKWRYTDGAYKVAKTIDGFCGDVYPSLGYLPITSQEHLLSNNPLFKDPVDLNIANT